MNDKILLAIVFVSIVFFFMKRGGLGAMDKKLILEDIKSGALVVDVRTPDEFASGHYKTSKNIPLDQIESRLKEFGDKNKTIVLYCRSGARAGRAKQLLESNGYTRVTNAGGLSDMP